MSRQLVILLQSGRSVWLVICLTLGLMTGCATGPTVLPPSARQIPNVPFHPDDSFRCGASSLASVLNHWHYRDSPTQVANAITSSAAGGTLTFDLVWYARHRGLVADYGPGSLDQLRQCIGSGMPPIVMIDWAFGQLDANHFMVIVAEDDRGFFAHSGTKPHQYFTNERLEKLWSRTNRWMLVAHPEGEPLPWASASPLP